MISLPGLPKHVVEFIAAVDFSQFATLTAAGVPINTPSLCFTSDNLSTIDIATGLAYPAKAERLRRRPKVGLWIDGVNPGEPTVSIAGVGAVRDSDIQSNALRYIAETGWFGTGAAESWNVQREAVWYWSRILMIVAPREILWWNEGEDLKSAPHRWEAPDNLPAPVSDPAPQAAPTSAPEWGRLNWRQLAEEALARNAPAHLSLIDEQGFPRPLAVLEVRMTDEGFLVEVPTCAPGRRNGKASLTFQGRENFIGEALGHGADVKFKVDRPLPILPMMSDPRELWRPASETRAALMARLSAELMRRGLPIPALPLEKPGPTVGAQRRAARLQHTPPRTGLR